MGEGIRIPGRNRICDFRNASRMLHKLLVSSVATLPAVVVFSGDVTAAMLVSLSNPLGLNSIPMLAFSFVLVEKYAHLSRE